jgi:hypothetical protein
LNSLSPLKFSHDFYQTSVGVVLVNGEPGELDDVWVLRPRRRHVHVRCAGRGAESGRPLPKAREQIRRTRSEMIDLISSRVEWTDVGDKWKCDAICRSAKGRWMLTTKDHNLEDHSKISLVYILPNVYNNVNKTRI